MALRLPVWEAPQTFRLTPAPEPQKPVWGPPDIANMMMEGISGIGKNFQQARQQNIQNAQQQQQFGIQQQELGMRRDQFGLQKDKFGLEKAEFDRKIAAQEEFNRTLQDITKNPAGAAMDLQAPGGPYGPQSQATPQGGYNTSGVAPTFTRPDMAVYAQAIGNIESRGSGDYSALGPVHKKMGQALGRYQVMEANLPQWTKSALGRSVGREEFLANPAIQDAVFQDQWSRNIAKYGSPSQAASVWFTGRPITAESARAKDALGTSGGGYVSKFDQQVAKITGGRMPQSAPQQVAGVRAPPPSPAVAPSQGGGPMAYEPGDPIGRARATLANPDSPQPMQVEARRILAAALQGGGQQQAQAAPQAAPQEAPLPPPRPTQVASLDPSVGVPTSPIAGAQQARGGAPLFPVPQQTAGLSIGLPPQGGQDFGGTPVGPRGTVQPGEVEEMLRRQQANPPPPQPGQGQVPGPGMTMQPGDVERLQQTPRGQQTYGGEQLPPRGPVGPQEAAQVQQATQVAQAPPPPAQGLPPAIQRGVQRDPRLLQLLGAAVRTGDPAAIRAAEHAIEMAGGGAAGKDAAGRFKFEKDEAGNIYRVDGLTGEFTPVPRAGGGQAGYREATPEEQRRTGAKYFGPDGKPIFGGASTTVNIDQKAESEGDKEKAKRLDKTIGTWTASGETALQSQTELEQLREIFNRNPDPQGAMVAAKQALGPYLEAAGIDVNGLSDVQVAQAIAERLAPRQRLEGSGSTSDIEYKGLLRSIPTLMQNPEARNDLLSAFEAQNQYDLARADIARRYNTDEITRAQALQEHSKLPKPAGLFKQLRSKHAGLFRQGHQDAAARGDAGDGVLPKSAPIVDVQSTEEALSKPAGTRVRLNGKTFVIQED